MLPRSHIAPALADLAATQGGVFTTSQARDHGTTPGDLRGLAKRGALTRLAHGVYSASGQGWTQNAWAGVLLGGDGAALGGRAAAHQWHLCDHPEVIDIWTPASHRPRADGPWRFRRGARPSRGTLPAVPPEVAVLEVCAEGSLDDAIAWLGRAVSSRRTHPRKLLQALEQMPKLRKRALLREFIDVVGNGVHSPLEMRWTTGVEQPHGLPVGLRQRSVSSGTRSDIVFEEFRTIIELDGQLGHRGADERRDTLRDAGHAAQGYATARFGWVGCTLGRCDTARITGDILRHGGWTGRFTPCRSCPPDAYA